MPVANRGAKNYKIKGANFSKTCLTIKKYHCKKNGTIITSYKAKAINNIKNNSYSPEYYDLPYHYNRTIVKVLAQTPNMLFIYWDISENDREFFKNKYGNDFFESTKPVLIVYNETMNYHFEVEINDFANSWYLKVNDSNCKYHMELGRRKINPTSNIPYDYIYVVSSNEMNSPNDHILFENQTNIIYYRNVLTNSIKQKNIAKLSFMKKIGKSSPIYELYKKIYSKEFEDLNVENLRNPSSSNPTSTFK